MLSAKGFLENKLSSYARYVTPWSVLVVGQTVRFPVKYNTSLISCDSTRVAIICVSSYSEWDILFFSIPALWIPLTYANNARIRTILKKTVSAEHSKLRYLPLENFLKVSPTQAQHRTATVKSSHFSSTLLSRNTSWSFLPKRRIWFIYDPLRRVKPSRPHRTRTPQPTGRILYFIVYCVI